MPAGHELIEKSQLLAPPTLKEFVGQVTQGAFPATPKVPARHGRDIVRIVGTLLPQDWPPERIVMVPPELKNGEKEACLAFMTDVAVELVLGPSKIENEPSLAQPQHQQQDAPPSKIEDRYSRGS